MIRNPFSRFDIARFASVAAVAVGVLLGDNAFGATASAAAPSRERRHEGSWGTMGRLTRTLSLTDDQAKQIKAIYDRHQAERTARSEAVKSAREELQKATLAIPVNEAGIRSTAQAVGQAEADSSLLEAKIRAQINVLLNPDQQQRFATYHDSGSGRGRPFLFRGMN